MSTTKTCTTCTKEIYGRKDKVFCSSKCKNIHHKQAKSQTSEIQKSTNLFIKRNYVVLEGLMGENSKRAKLCYQLLVKLGFDLKSFEEETIFRNKKFLKIGTYYFRLLSNNLVEVCKSIKSNTYTQVFYRRWNKIFEDWEGEYRRKYDEKNEFYFERLSFF